MHHILRDEEEEVNALCMCQRTLIDAHWGRNHVAPCSLCEYSVEEEQRTGLFCQGGLV